MRLRVYGLALTSYPAIPLVGAIAALSGLASSGVVDVRRTGGTPLRWPPSNRSCPDSFHRVG